MSIEKIKTMTKEERKRQLEWSDPNEFGTIYAEYLLEEKQEIIEFLKYSIKITSDFRKDEEDDDMFYLGKIRAFQQILSKIEKSDK